MIGTNEVITEVRKLAGTKPVAAAAGAGVAATAALRELPGRLTKLSQEAAVPSWSAAVSSFNGTVATLPSAVTGTVTTLPTVVTSLPGRWAGYVSTARTVAADRYDKLADIGREALGQGKATQTKGALNGKTTKATKTTKPAPKQTGQ
ncbi:MAG TPA: hypothetical protein VGS19_18885 [Streptosporangiaceae bacterium]|nr:hypothetical protein [Streptosporangiaceae bacterium]